MVAVAAFAVGARAQAEDFKQVAISTPADNRPITYTGSLPFGAYDPHGDFTNDKFAKIEHLFLPWEDVDLSFLSIADEYALARGREILITIEPWTWSKELHITPAKLRERMRTGYYNQTTRHICRLVKDYKSKTTIRWAQEMEETNGRFIWAAWQPSHFKAPYRILVVT